MSTRVPAPPRCDDVGKNPVHSKHDSFLPQTHITHVPGCGDDTKSERGLRFCGVYTSSIGYLEILCVEVDNATHAHASVISSKARSLF
jgi:hypothetical protein